MSLELYELSTLAIYRAIREAKHEQHRREGRFANPHEMLIRVTSNWEREPAGWLVSRGRPDHSRGIYPLAADVFESDDAGESESQYTEEIDRALIEFGFPFYRRRKWRQ